MKHIFYALTALVVIATATTAPAADLATWTFEGDVNTAASGSPANIGTATCDPVGAMNPGYFGGDGSGSARAATGWDGAPNSEARAMELVVNTVGYTNIQLVSFAGRSSGTGPQIGEVYYSLDGGSNWTATGGTFSQSGTSFQTHNVAVTFPAGANGLTDFRIRLAAWDASSSGGTWRVDDIMVTGDSGDDYSYAPTTVDFGPVDGTDTQELTITALNAASAFDVVFDSATGDTGVFSLDTNSVTVNPSGTGVFTFTFTAPDQSGDTHTATYNFTSTATPNNFSVTVTAKEATAANALLITQIMFNSQNDGTDAIGEFIEVINLSGSTVDLSGFVLDDGNSNAHGSANIPSGSIPSGEVAYLFNAEIQSVQSFKDVWGDVNAIPVTIWGTGNALNNSTDKVGIWDSFASYSGDHATHANALNSVEYDTNAPWPEIVSDASIYLTNLAGDQSDGANWLVATVGANAPTGSVGVQGVNVTDIAMIKTVIPDDPNLVVDALDFGMIDKDTSKTMALTLTNDGATSDLVITSASLVSSNFTLVTTLPLTIGAGLSDSFSVVFDPMGSTGTFSATLLIESNDQSNPLISVSVEGAVDLPPLAPAILIITQILDGDLAQGTPKAVEITNIGGETADLSLYGIDSSTNGNGFVLPVTLSLAGSELAGGESIVIVASGSEANYQAITGEAPDGVSAVVGINGNDAIGLFKEGVLIDIYGEAVHDDNDLAWRYQDSTAYRVPGITGPSTTWIESQWVIVSVADSELAGHIAVVGADVAGTSPELGYYPPVEITILEPLPQGVLDATPDMWSIYE